MLSAQIVYVPNLILLWFLAGKHIALAWYSLCMVATAIAAYVMAS